MMLEDPDQANVSLSADDIVIVHVTVGSTPLFQPYWTYHKA
jgi:hypothetical protein